MKKLVLAFAFLLLSSSVFSQLEFEKNIVIDPSFGPEQPRKHVIGDIDGDGDNDIVYSSLGDYKLVWAKNIDGTGQFGNEIIIHNLGNFNVTNITLYDIDHDADLDIIVTTYNSNDILLFENMDGNINDTPIVIISVNEVNEVLFGDLNNDNQEDLIVISEGDKISWFENVNNDGTFEDQTIITDLAIKANYTSLKDVDGDGDLDVITGLLNKVVWYENTDGLGDFSLENQIAYVNFGSHAKSFVAIDIDIDGDVDILSLKKIGFNDYTIRYQENINGSFEEHGLSGIIFLDDYVQLSAGDVDGDGDVDIVAAGSWNTPNLIAYLNDGNFESFTEKNMNMFDSGLDFLDVILKDLNNDGIVDVSTGFGEYYKISWFEYDQINDDFKQHVMTKDVDGLGKICTADIDNDGDLDIVSGALGDGQIAWYENIDGQGTMGFLRTIGNIFTNFPYVGDIQVGDLDSDGDTDIVVAYWGPFEENKVYWYKNLNGLGEFGDPILLDDTYYGSKSICIFDIDNDGDNDVVSGKLDSGENKIVYYQNNSGIGDFSAPITISDQIEGINSLNSADIDGDGDLDLISSSTSDKKIAWYENTDGVGSFGPQQVVTTDLLNPMTALPCDVNGDGNMDLISASPSGDKIVWYENVDGLGNFSEENIILLEAGDIQFVDYGDLDGDGDIDIVALASYDDLVWIENVDGQGTFGVIQDMDVSSGMTKIVVADMNGDNANDILSGGSSEIAWYKNNGIVKNEIRGNITFDIDNNGCDDLDIMARHQMLKTTSSDEEILGFSNHNGFYQLFADEGTYETELTSLPAYFAAEPNTQMTTFVGIGNLETIDFCLTATESIVDLEVVILPLSLVVPGFNAVYRIVYKNKGTMPIDGDISFEYDGALMSFVSSSDPFLSQTANSLVFDYSGIEPFETRTIDLVFETLPPPVVNINDTTSLVATINPLVGDYNDEDNVFSLDQVVVGAYDPNDITCLEGEAIDIADIDNYLHYVIRFQNTGTLAATNVRVDNTLDDQLDWSSLELINSSHTNRIEITNSNELSFIFDNINLPDSTNNEALSHGFIAYKIKPKSDVSVGDIFSSTASIYFDFNEAVITNTAMTEVVDIVKIDKINDFVYSIFPVPVNDVLTIKTKESIEQLEVYNQLGQLLYSEKESNYIQLGDCPTGVYTIIILTKNGKRGVQSFIKKY